MRAQWLGEPEVKEERGILLERDCEKEAQLVAETREWIIAGVKRAHRVPTRLEMHCYGDGSFYIKHYIRVCENLLQREREARKGRGGVEMSHGEQESTRELDH